MVCELGELTAKQIVLQNDCEDLPTTACCGSELWRPNNSAVEVDSIEINMPEIEDIKHDVRPREASNGGKETRMSIDHHSSRAFQSITLSSSM